MAANDGDHRVSDLFGVSLPAGTNAPGSAGASAHPAQADTALSSQVTGVYESVQNRPASDFTLGVGLDDSAEPGQLFEGFSGLGPAATADTGAGHGSTMARHPNAGGRS